MPSFKAQTRDEMEGKTTPKPGQSVACAEFEGLRELGATEFYPRMWQYRNKKHTLDDLTRPNYFGAGDTRDNLRVGDEITFCLELGKKLPSEWTRGIVVVEELPNTRQLPLIVAAIVLYPAAKPCVSDSKSKVA